MSVEDDPWELRLDVAIDAPMSELEAIRESLSEIEGLTKESLIAALYEMHRRLTEHEKARNNILEHRDNALQRLQLHARRCDLAVAICRDDEQGLTHYKLNQIAAVIWPLPADMTRTPTVLSTEQLTSKICAAEYLLGISDGLVQAVLQVMPEGFTLGEATQKTLTQWRLQLSLWRQGKPLE